MFCRGHGIQTRLNISALDDLARKNETFYVRKNTEHAQISSLNTKRRFCIRTEYTGTHHLLISEMEPPQGTVNV
jgi:hypothetical protein